MSAEKSVKDYLIDGKVDMIHNETLQLLESTLLKENYSIEPMKLIVKFFTGIHDIVGLKVLSSKKNMIQQGLSVTASTLSDSVFEAEDNNKTPNPVQQPLPKNKQEIDGYLKKVHSWLSSKIKIDYLKLRELFNKAYAFIVKACVGLGIVGTLIAVSYGGFLAGKKYGGSGTAGPPRQGYNGGTGKGSTYAGVAGALAGSLAIIFMAIIVVYLCIINAIDKSKGTEDLDFDTAFTNIIDGFKKVFTTIKIQKGEAKFGIISVLLSSLSVLFFKYCDVEEWIKQFKNYLGDKISKVWNIFKKVSPKLADAADTLKSGSGEELRRYCPGNITQAGEKFASALEDAGWNVTNKQNIDKYISGVVKHVSWFIKFIVVPLILFMSILYLFAELTDQFNLEKIRKGEESETQEDFI